MEGNLFCNGTKTKFPSAEGWAKPGVVREFKKMHLLSFLSCATLYLLNIDLILLNHAYTIHI